MAGKTGEFELRLALTRVPTAPFSSLSGPSPFGAAADALLVKASRPPSPFGGLGSRAEKWTRLELLVFAPPPRGTALTPATPSGALPRPSSLKVTSGLETLIPDLAPDREFGIGDTECKHDGGSGFGKVTTQSEAPQVPQSPESTKAAETDSHILFSVTAGPLGAKNRASYAARRRARASAERGPRRHPRRVGFSAGGRTPPMKLEDTDTELFVLPLGAARQKLGSIDVRPRAP